MAFICLTTLKETAVKSNTIFWEGIALNFTMLGWLSPSARVCFF